MKVHIRCTRKPKFRRAVTTECKVELGGSWLQRQKEKHDESQIPHSLVGKQMHSSGRTNYFLTLDSWRNVLWRASHKVHEYVYLTQISGLAMGFISLLGK